MTRLFACLVAALLWMDLSGSAQAQTHRYDHFENVADLDDSVLASSRYVERALQAQMECKVDNPAFLLDASRYIRDLQDELAAASFHGPFQSKLEARAQEWIALLQIQKAELRETLCPPTRPTIPEPPKPVATGSSPATTAVPPVSGPSAPTRKPRLIPADIRRPSLYAPPLPALPASFCSAQARNEFINGLYKASVDAAGDDARASTGYLQAIQTSAQHYLTPEGVAVRGALLDEYKAYEPVMTGTLEQVKALNAQYSQILAVPIRDCSRTAETAPPPPAVAVPGGFISPTRASTPTGGKPDCPPKVGRKAISVGPNGKVGSGARTKSKVASTVLGLAGGLLGGGGSPLGGGGGGDGPPMVNCRIKDSEMTVFRDPATGTALKVAAKRVKDTVTVFSKIDASPDSGTFQTAFMQKPDGAVLAPASVGICDLWGEWKLTVSWTRDTYQDNELVKHEAGGWSEGGKFALPGMASTAERPDGLWRRLGFSNASHGARMVALTYKVPPGELAATPMDLVVHVTRPSQDPVTTTPFAMTLAEGPSGFRLTGAGDDACPLPPARTLIADDANAGGGRLLNASNPPSDAPKTQVRPKPATSEHLTDLQADLEVIRSRVAGLGGAETLEGARLNQQQKVNELDERLRRLDEAIGQVAGGIDSAQADHDRLDARKIYDHKRDSAPTGQPVAERGVSAGLTALNAAEFEPAVPLSEAAVIWVEKGMKEWTLSGLREDIARQRLDLKDLQALKNKYTRDRAAEFHTLTEIQQGQREYNAKMAEVLAEEDRLNPKPAQTASSAGDAKPRQESDRDRAREGVRPARPTPPPPR